VKDTKGRLTFLLLFSLLYFVQGAAMAYFANFQKVYLVGLGIPISAVALLTSLLLLPFVLKIFFGIMSDRFYFGSWGNRKPFMAAGLILAMVGFMLCSINLPNKNFLLFSIFIIIASTGIALFDAATDGYAIDISDPQDYGLIQSFMVGGRALGVILLSLVFGKITASLDYKYVYLILAVLILAPLLWVIVMKVPSRTLIKNEPFSWLELKPLMNFGFLIFCGYAILYSFSSFGVDGLIPLYLSQHFHLNEESLGHYGALRGLGAVFGAIAFGVIFKKLQLKRSTFLALFLITTGSIGISYLMNASNFLFFAILWGSLWALQETCFVTLAMSESRIRYSGALFAFLMALSNFGTAIGEGVATGLSASIPYSKIFIALGLFTIIPLILIYFKFQTKFEKQF